jgi:hypothetical protein
MRKMLPSDALKFANLVRNLAAAISAFAASATVIAMYYQADRLWIAVTSASAAIISVFAGIKQTQFAGIVSKAKEEKAEADLASVRSALEKEAAERARLQAMTAWRRLEGDIRVRLIEALRKHTILEQVIVTTVGTDSEALTLAEDFIFAFREGGLNATGAFTTWQRASGLGIIEHELPGRKELKEALTEAGFFVTDREKNYVNTPSSIEFVVGSKLPPS